MSGWLDLSVPVVTGMPVYPGDPEVTVSPALRAPADGVNVLALHLGSQSGTHLDAPYHVDDAWPRLDELPLDRFAGRAVVADLRGLPARSPITPALLAPALDALAAAPGALLLLATGWSAHWGTDMYLAHPWLTPEAAEAVVAAGTRTVAVDALSVDPTPPPGDPHAGSGLPAHRVLCGAGGVIAENLTGLERLVGAEEVEVFLFPLRLRGADGAPVRAIARVG
ncbi:cyclase [Streptomyces cellostaticus]|uniref:Cyclase n=1 Tax=Streptomyces cellostaticus TaxID=67285 RepID=A0A124HDB2_9ACTN|nr:cyclase family protein [Streptomyces cellostaticus]KUM97041.1 cyclase [Streptomyces cellostaticus]GHI03703.1 cyclase [Streptomyces cellostaticus]